MTLQQRISTSRMSPYQWLIVGLCVWLNALDGFDVMSMAFTANRITQELGLSGAELGMLFSLALFGMAIGSLVLAPFADVIGRRPMIIGATAFAGSGMVLAGLSNSYLTLGIFRFLTGLGVGAILASITVLVSEYANSKHRGLAIGIFTAGYGIGASIGGLTAVGLIEDYGWRSVFLVGGIATLITAAVMLALIPESVDFLLVKQPAGVLKKLNMICRKIGQAPVTDLTAEQATAHHHKTTGTKVGALLAPHMRRTTIVLWVLFFLVMFGFYFINSWTPRLLTTAGMTEDQGIIAGLLISLGGAIGSVLYGAVAAKRNSRNLLIVFAVASAVTMAAFILTTDFLIIAMVLAVLVGMLINGSLAGAYTVTPPRYPAQIRGTAMGWAIGIGRIGAILAPIFAGVLLDNNWTPVGLYLAAAVIVLAASLVALLLPKEVPNQHATLGPSRLENAGAKT